MTTKRNTSVPTLYHTLFKAIYRALMLVVQNRQSNQEAKREFLEAAGTAILPLHLPIVLYTMQRVFVHLAFSVLRWPPLAKVNKAAVSKAMLVAMQRHLEIPPQGGKRTLVLLTDDQKTICDRIAFGLVGCLGDEEGFFGKPIYQEHMEVAQQAVWVLAFDKIPSRITHPEQLRVTMLRVLAELVSLPLAFDDCELSVHGAECLARLVTQRNPA